MIILCIGVLSHPQVTKYLDCVPEKGQLKNSEVKDWQILSKMFIGLIVIDAAEYNAGLIFELGLLLLLNLAVSAKN